MTGLQLHTAVIVLLSAALLHEVTSQECPAGFTRLVTGCYLSGDSISVSLYDAEIFCYDNGADLVRIETGLESSELANWLQNEGYWTNLRLDGGVWNWPIATDGSGEPAIYTQWGNSGTASNDGDCMVVYGVTGNWYSIPCGTETPFRPLCEIDEETPESLPGAPELFEDSAPEVDVDGDGVEDSVDADPEDPNIGELPVEPEVDEEVPESLPGAPELFEDSAPEVDADEDEDDEEEYEEEDAGEEEDADEEEDEPGCVFPFKYEDSSYTSCIHDDISGLWCSTTADYDTDMQWKTCKAGAGAPELVEDSAPEVDADEDEDADDDDALPACNVENCAQCKRTSSEACRFCEDGYRRIARGRQCQHVTHENECQVDNCLFCKTNDATRCRRCEGGFLRRRGGRKCKELPHCDVDGCRICHMRSTKKCKICNTGLMKTHQGKSCVPRE